MTVAKIEAVFKTINNKYSDNETITIEEKKELESILNHLWETTGMKMKATLREYYEKLALIREELKIKENSNIEVKFSRMKVSNYKCYGNIKRYLYITIYIDGKIKDMRNKKVKELSKKICNGYHWNQGCKAFIKGMI